MKESTLVFDSVVYVFKFVVLDPSLTNLFPTSYFLISQLLTLSSFPKVLKADIMLPHSKWENCTLDFGAFFGFSFSWKKKFNSIQADTPL